YSAYNPVERSMTTLLGKLVGMVLPVDHYSIHLDSQDNKQDNIFEKPVVTEYVNMKNVKKYNNIKCCSLKRCEEAASLFASNDGFLLSQAIRKDRHYINLIHLLEYFSKKKIPEYNQLCSFITDNYINYLCSVCKKYFLTVLMVTVYKKSQLSKKVSLTKHKPERSKKTKTTAKKVCPTKYRPGRLKKLI
ncbi:2497_t:CDS:2, partial [Cetraspora pellucida]